MKTPVASARSGYESLATILHIEDDEFLADAVHSAFEAFGFPGTFLTVSTLNEARRMLADPAQHLDLVISDMGLPDGSGLDVVREVRSTPSRRRVPILILSGRADASSVGRAYALGASSYVTKTVPGRTTTQIVRAIYDHWLRDVLLPPAGASGRIENVIRRAMSIRSRISRHYMTIAERLRTDEEDFWMGVAQREGNLANLLMFLLSRVGDRELPDDVVDELEARQQETLRVLDELERESPKTTDDAFRYLIALSAPTDSKAFARFVGLLFPSPPLAMRTLLDAQAHGFEVVSQQIDAHTNDPILREQAHDLRAKAALLRHPPSLFDHSRTGS